MAKEIQLTQGYMAIVDDEDYERLITHKWQSDYLKGRSQVYAKRTRSKKKEMMHRLIMNVKDSKIYIDHINGNGLDNRKENSRICDNIKNGQNRKKHKNGTSKYKGVNWHKNEKKWHSRITLNKKTIHLGAFNTEKEAASVYNKAAKELFGEFAKLNIIED